MVAGQRLWNVQPFIEFHLTQFSSGRVITSSITLELRTFPAFLVVSHIGLRLYVVPGGAVIANWPAVPAADDGSVCPLSCADSVCPLSCSLRQIVPAITYVVERARPGCSVADVLRLERLVLDKLGINVDHVVERARALLAD